MTTFNELTTQDTVVSSDQIPIYSTTNGQPRKASALALATFTASNLPTATIAGAASVGGALTVAGNATVGGTFAVTGITTLNNVTSRVVNLIPQTTPTYARGNVWYDSTTEALSVQDDITGTSVQLGQENFIRVRNNTGVQINDASVVYISGASGQSPTAALAKADAAATSRVIGVATHNIANNTIGKITTYGLVNDINTSAFTDGDIVYLSSTVAGGLVNVAPTGAGTTVVKVGIVEFSHVSQGKLFVDPDSGANFASPPAIGNITPNSVKTSNLQATFTDSTGTPGNVTNNSPRGRVAFGAGAATVVVTSSLVTAASMIIVTLRTPDTALTDVLRVLPTAGSFTITANAASTGTAAQADFLVVN